MSYAVSNAFTWLAGAIYVIIALAIVYLYFFKLVPTVFNSVSSWTLGAVIQVTLVLAAIAILLGGVAVFTADWIFTQVLTSLPNTRIAYEINRVTGSVVQLPTQGYGAPGDRPYSPYAAPQGSAPAPYNSGANSGPTVLGSGAIGPAPGADEPAASALGSSAAGGSGSYPQDDPQRLKANALEIWASVVQEVYNPTGNISDNTSVMSKRDIPQGVQCDVFAVADGIWTKRYEDWNLACSDDGFRDVVTITVNGTAARGLTGGKFYSAENPLPVFGTGLWPELAFEPAPPAAPTSDAPSSSTSGGGSSETNDPVSNASSTTPGANATPAADGPRTHTVESGESLASIAQQYDISVQILINQNIQRYPALQENPNVIRTGWTLVIPE